MKENSMTFKYKGEEIILEFTANNELKWVYAYNMRMRFSVLPYDLKEEVKYILSRKGE